MSLPASLLDPVSNLEYWNYMDRPDLFAVIPDSDDPLDRMLNVIKWWYSKETKWIVSDSFHHHHHHIMRGLFNIYLFGDDV